MATLFVTPLIRQMAEMCSEDHRLQPIHMTRVCGVEMSDDSPEALDMAAREVEPRNRL